MTKHGKRGIAVLTAVFLAMSGLPVSAGNQDNLEMDMTGELLDSDGNAGSEDASSGTEEDSDWGKESDEEWQEAETGESTGEETDSEEEVSGEETDSEEEVSGEEKDPEEEVSWEETDFEEEILGEETDSEEEVSGEETDFEEEILGGETDSDEEQTESEEPDFETDEILFNTGNCAWSVVNADAFDRGMGDAYFQEDGSYTISIPEDNPFFPYEVQFTCEGKVANCWFMTPDDSVEVGGHRFYVSAYFDHTAVTQLSLNVGGDTVIVYPEKKEFTDGDGMEAYSLLPLKEVFLNVDLSAYTPVELTRVSPFVLLGEELADTDKVVWTYGTYGDDYTISESGDLLDLSRSTYRGGRNTWQMIVGEADQLAADNTRYIVQVEVMESRHWLKSAACIQDSDGNRTSLSVLTDSYYYDYAEDVRRQYIYVSAGEFGSETQAYVSLGVNEAVFDNAADIRFRVYEGQFSDPAEAATSGTEITDQICSADMTQADAGYLVKKYQDNWITVVTFDSNGDPTGCLPFHLYLSVQSNYISYGLMFQRDAEGSRTYVSNVSSATISGGCEYRTVTLLKGYPADSDYYYYLSYYKAGTSTPDAVTAAYKGSYTSIEEAEQDGAEEIKGSLFNSDYRTGGYCADYSQGVYFTVFIGEDGDENQEIYHCCIQTKEGTTSSGQAALNSGTAVTFSGLRNSNGGNVPCYVVDYDEDSYAEYNYLTIMIGEDADLSGLAPVFTTSSGVKLYAAGNMSPEVSGESVHDFSAGPVQYTASAENGTNSKNYWLRVIKPTGDAADLYINSLSDSSSDTKMENGVIYSTREVILDSYHKNQHDILLVNMGAEVLPALSVELDSEVVELDDYWTLSGNYDLAGFSVINVNSSSYGELPNLAKIRLRVKEGVSEGADISGTLTIKSAGTTWMVLTLTGTVGNPVITTEEVPEAVKYVPYGTMIQNNNKYSWNHVSYSVYYGSLPAGMEVKPNGEIYGVPSETGTFAFTVRMDNSYSSFGSSYKSYLFVVEENTDENVNAATDEGYDLTQRVLDLSLSNGAADQTLVSQGEYGEFVNVYLDGVKLEEGVDFTSEPGSTRITILAETFANKGANSIGTHTLGIEFRTEGTELLKRAAQNFKVQDGKADDSGDKSDSENNGSDNKGGNTSNESGSANGGNRGAGSAGAAGGTDDGIGDEDDAVVAFSPYWMMVRDEVHDMAERTGSGSIPGSINMDFAVKEETKVPAYVLAELQGTNITAAFHNGFGIALSVSGWNLAGVDISEIEYVDLAAVCDTDRIPKQVVAEKVSPESYWRQISLLSAVGMSVPVNLHVAVGEEYVGQYANLYRYNAESGVLEYCGSFRIVNGGLAMFAVREGGDYLLTVTDGLPVETVLYPEELDVQKPDGKSEDFYEEYVVQPGDTLTAIAKRNGIPLLELIGRNPQIADIDLIRPGQILRLK